MWHWALWKVLNNKNFKVFYYGFIKFQKKNIETLLKDGFQFIVKN